MGVIANKCCKYNTNENTLKNLEGIERNEDISKIIKSNHIDENISVNSHTFTSKRRVTFSTVVEQRNFHCEEEKEYDNIPFEDIQKDPQSDHHLNEEIVINISFEITENYFVIEDCFYKVNHQLAKTSIELKLSSNVDDLNQNRLRDGINETIQNVKEKSNRIDGIIYIEISSLLIILTEFFILELKLDEEKFIATKKISIQDIDFITLTRDGNKIIFHLIDNKTYIINYFKLERVAACICATYFYDKTGIEVGSENINRHISVIVVNENFDVLLNLERVSDFFEYKQILNDFLKHKLNEANIETDNLVFKYVSVKYKNNNLHLLSADLIIFKEFILLLEYTSNKFKEIHKIYFNKMTRIIPSRKNNSIKIFDKVDLMIEGLELVTESYAALLILIDEIVREYKKSKNLNQN